MATVEPGPLFMHDISTWERFKLSVKWPTIRKLMIQRMDLGYAQGLASLVAPKEYRCSNLMTLPPRALQESLPMRERVFWRWVVQQYENFRASSEVNPKNR